MIGWHKQSSNSDIHLRKRELVILIFFCQVLKTFVLILKYSTKELGSFESMNA